MKRFIFAFAILLATPVFANDRLADAMFENMCRNVSYVQRICHNRCQKAKPGKRSACTQRCFAHAVKTNEACINLGIVPN